MTRLPIRERLTEALREYRESIAVGVLAFLVAAFVLLQLC